MKSIEIQFNEALDALDWAGKRKQFDAKVRSGMSIESRLNVAEKLLREAGININNLEEIAESASVTARIEELRERQYKSCLAGGMNEAEARKFADLCGTQR
jgi:hypothetical protein